MICDLAYSPKGNLILSSSLLGVLRWWNPATGEETQPAAHAGNRPFLAIAPDGRQALSAGGISEGAPLRLWSVPGGRVLKEVPLASGTSFGSVFLADNQRVVFADGGNLRMLDLETGTELCPFVGHTKPVSGVAFSRDGRLLLSWSQDDTLRLWDIAMGRDLERFKSPVKARCGLFSPTARYALTLGSTDKEPPRLWDVASGAELRKLAGHAGVFDAAFATDDRHVLTAESETGQQGSVVTVRRWEVETGKDEVLCAIKDVKGSSLSVSPGTRLLTPDGSKILSQDSSNGALFPLWNLADCRKVGQGTITTTIGDGSGTGVIALAPDGGRCYFGSVNGTVGYCDLRAEKGQMETFLKYHQSRVQALAIAPRAPSWPRPTRMVW